VFPIDNSNVEVEGHKAIQMEFPDAEREIHPQMDTLSEEKLFMGELPQGR